jgi:NRPS condensation-like uncharacterized protein
MTETRKHRLYIDVTFDRKLNSRRAAKALRYKLSTLDLTTPIYVSDKSPRVNKISVVELRNAKP